MALGSYPAVSLASARKARDAAKLQKSSGTDPVLARKLEKIKATVESGNTFKDIALDWLALKEEGWSESHAIRTKRNLEKDLFPCIGSRPMIEITPMEVLKAVQKVEDRGSLVELPHFTGQFDLLEQGHRLQ
jgi:hypothetical protein